MLLQSIERLQMRAFVISSVGVAEGVSAVGEAQAAGTGLSAVSVTLARLPGSLAAQAAAETPDLRGGVVFTLQESGSPVDLGVSRGP